MKKICIVILLAIPPFISQLVGCSENSQFASKNVAKGFELSKQYCVSCHLLPTPELLDKQTWLNHVLPKMGSLLGFVDLGNGSFVSNGKSALPLADWNNIVLYYYSQAPKELPDDNQLSISLQTDQFSLDTLLRSHEEAATTLVKAIPATSLVWFANGASQKMYSVRDGGITDSLNVEVGVSNMHNGSDELMILSMGLLYPSNEKKGRLTSIGNKSRKPIVIIDSLQRPVHAAYADLDDDGLEDVVICEFGDSQGSLSWFKKQGNQQPYKKHVLRNQPGAIVSAIHDFDSDGRKDIIALMAQGDEGVFIYYNKGNGLFAEERLLQFPPSYGSNSLQVIDMNNDGFVDLVTSNGDNGDYPPIKKYYHGIRIFINDGTNHFEQQQFLPVNGIGKVVAEDFDRDGDVDLASVSFFPDFEKSPQQGFVYWKNKGDLKFDASSVAQFDKGRWITIDAADLDGDDYAEIIIGSANFKLGNVPKAAKSVWDKDPYSIMILKNNGSQKGAN